MAELAANSTGEEAFSDDAFADFRSRCERCWTTNYEVIESIAVS